jgi:hypothetical protein
VSSPRAEQDSRIIDQAHSATPSGDQLRWPLFRRRGSRPNQYRILYSTHPKVENILHAPDVRLHNLHAYNELLFGTDIAVFAIEQQID